MTLELSLCTIVAIDHIINRLVIYWYEIADLARKNISSEVNLQIYKINLNENLGRFYCLVTSFQQWVKNYNKEKRVGRGKFEVFTYTIVGLIYLLPTNLVAMVKL